jgi:hypothetical protein
VRCDPASRVAVLSFYNSFFAILPLGIIPIMHTDAMFVGGSNDESGTLVPTGCSFVIKHSDIGENVSMYKCS